MTWVPPPSGTHRSPLFPSQLYYSSMAQSASTHMAKYWAHWCILSSKSQFSVAISYDALVTMILVILHVLDQESPKITQLPVGEEGRGGVEGGGVAPVKRLRNDAVGFCPANLTSPLISPMVFLPASMSRCVDFPASITICWSATILHHFRFLPPHDGIVQQFPPPGRRGG